MPRVLICYYGNYSFLPNHDKLSVFQWDSTMLAKDRFLQIIAVDNVILGYMALGFAVIFMALLLWDVFRWKLGKTRKKHGKYFRLISKLPIIAISIM